MWLKHKYKGGGKGEFDFQGVLGQDVEPQISPDVSIGVNVCMKVRNILKRIE